MAADLAKHGVFTVTFVSKESRKYNKMFGKKPLPLYTKPRQTGAFPALQQLQPEPQAKAEYLQDIEARMFGVLSDAVKSNGDTGCATVRANSDAAGVAIGKSTEIAERMLKMVLDANCYVNKTTVDGNTIAIHEARETYKEASKAAGEEFRRKLKAAAAAAAAETAKAQAEAAKAQADAILQRAVNESWDMQMKAREARRAEWERTGSTALCPFPATCNLDCGMGHALNCYCPFGATCMDRWCDRFHPYGRRVCVSRLCRGNACVFVHVRVNAPAPSVVPTCRVLE